LPFIIFTDKDIENASDFSEIVIEFSFNSSFSMVIKDKQGYPPTDIPTIQTLHPRKEGCISFPINAPVLLTDTLAKAMHAEGIPY
jgi:hypothetical protein